jgi:uncharacterized protein with NRDE domain
MCLLFFAYKQSPKYNLILAANRDEFLERPTAPLGFLDDEKTIFGGKDLRGGGTWLAVSQSGKIGAITNYRDPALMKVDAPTRGEIILNFLRQECSAAEYLAKLAEKGNTYDGFNLILGDHEGLYYYSNVRTEFSRLEPGFYGLSNHLLDTPWPKVVRGKDLLKQYLVNVECVETEKIFSFLEDENQPPDDMLPATGVGHTWERLLSTIFIDGPGYGTRSSAIIVTDTEVGFRFLEKFYRRESKHGRITSLVEMSV